MYSCTCDSTYVYSTSPSPSNICQVFGFERHIFVSLGKLKLLEIWLVLPEISMDHYVRAMALRKVVQHKQKPARPLATALKQLPCLQLTYT